MAMNYLEKKRQEEQQARPAGLQGVSENTRTQQAKYEGGYNPSQQTQQAQQNLQAVQMQKPQTFNSKYGAALDSILQQIQNQQDFKYSFDGDEMFKYYADLYTQQAKQGAQNAMGQAVGLTGGYGNSWASAQANQAYQQALLPLFDRGMDLRDRAYQQYQDKQANMMDRAGLLQSMDATDYGRYRDTMSDYYADLDRAQAAADNERAFDYNQYRDMLNYWQNAAGMENADFRADQDEAFRQAQLEEQKRGTDLDEAYRRDTLGWQQATDARDFAESVRRADQDEAFRQAQFGWQQSTDARDFAESVRRADQDEQYRRDQMDWQQATDARDYAEAVRRADLDEQYRQAQFGWQQATDDRDYKENVRRADQDEAYRQQAFGEQVRQADLDEAYRQQTFNENVRQANLDEQYRRDSLQQNADQFAATTAMDWANLAEKQRQFDSSLSEEQREFNTKNAIALCSDILANGQIPSTDLLIQAGISYEDAQKLIAQATGGGTGGTTTTPTEKQVMNAVTVGLVDKKTGAVTGGILKGLGNDDYVRSLAEAAEAQAKNATGEDKKIYEELAKKYRDMLK